MVKMQGQVRMQGLQGEKTGLYGKRTRAVKRITADVISMQRQVGFKRGYG